MLEARKGSEKSESGFQVVYRSDGSVAEIRGLAEVIRTARMRIRNEELPASFPASEGGQESDGGRREDCLSERVTMARERLKRAQGPETMP